MIDPAALFAEPGPRWFAIAPHRPFLRDLASTLLKALEPQGPEALADTIVLTPTRRGARALASAFAEAAGGRPVLPPQIRALGDLDEGEPPFEPGDLALELPPAIGAQRRRFELTRIVAEAGRFDSPSDLHHALALADAIGAFLDSAAIEEIEAGPDQIARLVEGELARHWQDAAGLLTTVVAAWPKRLEDLSLVDAPARRIQLLRLLADRWDRNPPTRPLIAAGSTGTAPSTADLLGVIAAAPQGAVVLPGLDLSLADDAWAGVGAAHPQGAMKALLARHRIDRAQVRAWPAEETMGEARRGGARQRLINEALRPAEATADWRRVIDRLQAEGAATGLDPVAEGLKGLSVTTARTEEEAATAAALLLREALETPGRTAALVTPDLALARRVSARLCRWGIEIDSSQGSPLAGCPVGVLTGLVASLIADPADPVRLLAVLKHPLVRLGLEPAELRRSARRLEARALRGARCDDLDGYRKRWEQADERARPKRTEEQAADHDQKRAAGLELLDRLEAALTLARAPFAEGPARADRAARALAEALEALAAGGLALWAGTDGEAAAALFAELIAEGEALPPVNPLGFADLVDGLMQDQAVRSERPAHPRLQILGAIEARLVRADRLVIAGLEEGVWPPAAPQDPFLSRPMRTSLGLPPPERRLGLAAHDFAQAACAPEAALIVCERRGGAPAVMSRWLWRLHTLLKGAGRGLPEHPGLLDWARSLDAAEGAYAPAVRPEPRPPVEHRPTKLAVTRVEALTRDPYAVWARDILGLRQLERPDEPVEARARGTAIHKAFERFALAHPTTVPPDAADQFAKLYLEALVEAGAPPESLARERALAREAAQWVAEVETRRRAGGVALHVEAEGALELIVEGRPFTLTAKADRIETTRDGFAHVLDYKTGGAPSQKQVDTGFSPQLTLTAAILAHGGFEGIGAVIPGELVYLRVTGRDPAGEEQYRALAVGNGKLASGADAANQALEGLIKLIRRYGDPDQPYRSRTAPQFVRDRAGDYDHLARVFEWSTAGDDGDGE